MVKTYRGAILENANAVDLVVALYDGLIRFIGDAAEATERGDVVGRRAAAKRALDILIHLQATLRLDIGGKPAEALAEFYASIFASILRASNAAAPSEFRNAIRCVRTFREAWQTVAQECSPRQLLPPDLRTREERSSSTAAEVNAKRSESSLDEGTRSVQWMV